MKTRVTTIALLLLIGGAGLAAKGPKGTPLEITCSTTVEAPGTYYATNGVTGCTTSDPTVRITANEVTIDMRGVRTGRDGSGTGIRIDADNVTIIGAVLRDSERGILGIGNDLTVDSADIVGGEVGILLNGERGAVRNSRVKNSSFVAIETRGSDARIINNLVSGGAEHGIIAGGDSRVDSNVVSGVGDGGIDVGNNSVVHANRVTGNHTDSSSGAIAAGNGSTVTDNVVLDNTTTSSRSGIDAGENSLIAGNVSSGNQGTGIFLGWSGVTVRDNIVSGNRAGIQTYAHIGNQTVERNIVTGNDTFGIEVTSPGSVITGNVTSGNGAIGLLARGTIKGNTSTGNGQGGLWVFGGSVATKNESDGNGDVGIYANGLDITLKSNSASSNGGDGIRAGRDDPSTTFSKNIALDNVEDGIDAGSLVRGQKNRASGNGGTDCTNASLC